MKHKDIYNKYKEAIAKSLGISGIVCHQLGITKRAFDRMLERHPELKEELEIEREKVKDLVQWKIYKKAIDEEDTTCLIFLCKTLLRDRGFGTNFSDNVETLPPLKIEIVERRNE